MTPLLWFVCMWVSHAVFCCNNVKLVIRSREEMEESGQRRTDWSKRVSQCCRGDIQNTGGTYAKMEFMRLHQAFLIQSQLRRTHVESCHAVKWQHNEWKSFLYCKNDFHSFHSIPHQGHRPSSPWIVCQGLY